LLLEAPADLLLLTLLLAPLFVLETTL